MHLFFYGLSGAGKSYAIEAALRAQNIVPKHGVRSRKLDVGGVSRLYVGLREGRPAACWSAAGFLELPGTFDSVAEDLKGITPGESIIMDELGRFERDAREFQHAVLEALRFPCRCIGVLKQADIPFLNAVRAVEGVETLRVTKETRQQTYEKALDFLRPRGMAEALGIRPGITAFVGGGGKTSLLNALGRELAAHSRVILCTSARIAVQTDLPLLLSATPAGIRAAFGHGNLLLLGETERWELCAPKVPFFALAELADYVLVEADNAEGLSLNAHAAQEIPASADTVYVLGADCFFKPICEAAHRPELYAAALGVDKEHIVQPEDAARLADHGRVVLVNKVESAESLRAAREFARLAGRRTVLAALKHSPNAIEIWEDAKCLW